MSLHEIWQNFLDLEYSGKIGFNILIYTIWNYKTLSAEEGWGIVAMFGLAGIGVVAGLADLILQRLVKSRKAINIVGLIIVVGLAIAILSDL